jgi:hypothetical protein
MLRGRRVRGEERANDVEIAPPRVRVDEGIDGLGEGRFASEMSHGRMAPRAPCIGSRYRPAIDIHHWTPGASGDIESGLRLRAQSIGEALLQFSERRRYRR